MKKGIKAMKKATLVSAQGVGVGLTVPPRITPTLDEPSRLMVGASSGASISSLGTDIGRLRGEVRVLQQARQQAVGRAAESLAGGIALVRSVVAGLDADGGDVGRGS